jgi:AraC-like DNA-binding protein
MALRLLASDLPVRAIALRLGFASSQTFARFLRREFGATATALRLRAPQTDLDPTG